MCVSRTLPTLCLLLIVTVAGSAPARGQTPGSTPHTPDLLGIYPGMPMNQARAMLQKHSSAVNVISSIPAETGFSLTVPDPEDRDITEVFLTQAPNVPAVWMIRRTQNLSRAKPMSKAVVLSALRGKYGKETLTMDRGGGGLYLFWVFDQNGHLLPSAQQDLTGCSGSTFVANMRTGPPQTKTGPEKICYGSFFALTAMFNSLDAELLQAYTVELVNLPYAVRAATVTLNAKNAKDNQARQNDVKKANENKPVF